MKLFSTLYFITPHTTETANQKQETSDFFSNGNHRKIEWTLCYVNAYQCKRATLNAEKESDSEGKNMQFIATHSEAIYRIGEF